MAERHPHLVGREPELARLDAAVAAVSAGASRVLVVSGEPGIGKSALLSELARRSRAAGLLALCGRAAEQERDLPFGLAIDALDDHVAGLHAAGAHMPAGELGSVLPALASDPPSTAPASPAQRFRLHRALRGLVEELAADAPVALLLDDLHWADPASLEWVLHALRRPARRPHLLALALRPVDPLPQLLEAIRGAAGDAHLAVGPLADEAALELLAAVPESRRRRLVDEAGGNPLFLEGLARMGPDEAHLPATVLAAVQLEVRGLPPASRALLEGAAVAGDPFDADLAATVAGLGADGLVALDRLVAAGLVHPTEGGGFRFRHPLVRRAVHDAAPPGWRIAAHGRAAAALAARGTGPLGLAHHVEQAATVGDAEAAATLAAAARAGAATAPDTAARWFRAALRLEPGAPLQRRGELLNGLAQALAAAGRHAEAHEVLLDVIGLLPSEAVALRLEVVAATATVEHALGRHDDARRRIEHALDGVPDPPGALRARLDYELAVGALHLQDVPELRRVAGRSAAGLRASEPALAAADEALGVIAALWAGKPEELESRLGRMRAGVGALDRAAWRARPDVAYFAGYAALFTEHLAEGIGYAASGLAAIREGGQDRMLVALAAMHAMATQTAGDQAAAAESGEIAEEAARLQRLDYLLQWCLWVNAFTAHLQGDRGASARLADECRTVMGRVGDVLYTRVGRCNLATLLVDEAPARAAAEIEAAAGAGFERVDVTWSSYVIGAYVRALLATDRRTDAEAAATLLEARTATSPLPMTRGRALHARAELLLADGHPGPAAERARAAAEIAEARGYGVDAFHAELTLGRALGRSGRREAAVEVLRGAAARAAAGASWGLRDVATRELRRMGSRLDSAGLAAADDRGLSDRERQIAALVAAGRSNKEVASLLFLSPKTVEHALTRVYAKVGVRSRTELAAALG